VIGIDGGTESIRACCFDTATGKVVGQPCAVPYPTRHPHPGWAEQDPEEWYTNLGQAVRGALASIEDPVLENMQVLALCVDTTCCSVVALDQEGAVLRPCLLWMDQRAALQTKTILDKCWGDPALAVNCNGDGPLSAEWMIPKALWIKESEPEVWQQAATICEYQDYINLRLTGRLVASACNAATRWHWDGEASLQAKQHTDDYPGRPLSLYEKLGLSELADKLPSDCLPMGQVIGGLTPVAAAHLGLTAGVPVVQGGPDAFVGMVGLGCVQNGQLCLITGSSHLHCVVTDASRTAPGTWGAYRGAPLQGTFFAEGGQSSTGSLLRWARDLFGMQDVSYAILDKEAAAIPRGADGLVALETFQGARTPVTDPMAKGALLGLTLSHTRGHIWRALMEAVCYGTRACMEGLMDAGHACQEIILAGGIAKSQLWLQMHADVTGKPVLVCENTDAPLLGCAILAAVGVGKYASVDEAIAAMVRVAKRVEPDPVAHAEYTRIYREVYQPMVGSVRGVSHALHQLRGGDQSRVPEDLEMPEKKSPQDRQRPVIISPSLLACDWGQIRNEVARCLEAGATRLHVDVFDGVFLDSPWAFTFGPAMVRVLAEAVGQDGHLDLHLCVQNPACFVDALAQVAPGHTFVFQWEAVASLDAATVLAEQIVAANMQCGISLNPSTPIEPILPLLRTGLVTLVDVLAVEPGFGGQAFQKTILPKVEALRRWVDEHQQQQPTSQTRLLLLVDGGINSATSSDVRAAGADILVSGSYLFRQDLREGIASLLQ
jgi:ribulose-phosphate 3-epimerase